MKSNFVAWLEADVKDRIRVQAFIAWALACTLLISACSKAPQSQQPITLNYQCESGETINASYDSTDTVSVQYKGQTHKMQIAVSASGARYAGDGLEWWTKGSGTGAEGTLFRHQEDGTSGESIETCAEQ